MRRSVLPMLLLAIGIVLLGCEEKRRLTILFTSDVSSWLTPAG